MKFLIVCLLSLFVVPVFAVNPRHIVLYHIGDGAHQINLETMYRGGEHFETGNQTPYNTLHQIECFAYDEKQRPYSVNWDLRIEGLHPAHLKNVDNHIFTKDAYVKIDVHTSSITVAAYMKDRSVAPYANIICYPK